MRSLTLPTTLFLLINSALFGQANFQNVAIEAGVQASDKCYGVSFGDFNNDFKDDIYVIRRPGENLLYKNLGDGTFEEVGASAGVNDYNMSAMAVWGDINNDNWLDLFLGNYDVPNRLYLNNGDGTFSEIAEAAGVASSTRIKAVMFSDIDNDGFIDLYLANINEENLLYKNNGDNTFSDFTIESGATDTQTSMGSIFFDYDNDGDCDLYLTHDANQPYIMYQNDGTGHFTDVSLETGTNYAGQGMGVDVGDINQDGWQDIYITNLNYNTLYLNNGDGTFSDISSAAGVTDQGMGWGTTFLDFNNDGWLDIYMVNDSYFTPFPNILYQNQGDNSFENVSANSDLSSMFGGYGTACSDFNDDGKVDIFVANNGQNDFTELFENQTETENNWVKIKLLGVQSNRAAIGAKVEIILDTGIKLVEEVCAGSGYTGQNSLMLHFGLGDMEIIQDMFVHWPSGAKELFGGMEVNKTYVIEENMGVTTSTNSIATPIFSVNLSPNPVSDILKIEIKSEKSTESELVIWDANGKSVSSLFNGNLPNGSMDFEINVNDLPNGIYVLQVKSGEFSHSRKFMVSK